MKFNENFKSLDVYYCTSCNESNLRGLQFLFCYFLDRAVEVEATLEDIVTSDLLRRENMLSTMSTTSLWMRQGQ